MGDGVEKKITAKYILDSSGFNAGLQGINSNLKLSQSELKNANASVGVFGKSSENLKAVQESLAKQIELHAKKVDIYKESIIKTTSKMNDNIKERDKLKASLASANSKYEEAVKIYGKESVEAKKAKEEVTKLTTELKNKEKAVENNARSINGYTENLNKAETEMKKTQGELKKVSTELVVSGNGWTKAGDGIKKVGANMSATGDKIKNVGTGITKAGAVVTATFGVIGGGAIKAYEEVKTGTDQIAKLTGATGKQFTDLKDIYKDVARESAASFEDIGTAVGTVSVRLGLTGNSLKQASLDFMKFAKVNKTEVSTSIALVSRAMGDAGIKTTEYKNVLDLLTTASQKSGIKVDVLAESLAKYGAPMRALGFDTKSTIALFSGWEKAGVTIEIAFGGMKKAISNWGAAGKDSAVEFKKLLKDIKDTPTLAGATTKAIKVFGQKAGPDLADAIKGGRFAYEDFLKVLDGSKGTLDATSKNIEGKSAEMKKAWHSVTLASAELGESIVKELAPIMKNIAITVKDLTKHWNGLSDSTKQSIVKFGLVTIAVGGVATVLGGAIIGVGGFIKGLGGIVSVGGSAVGAVGNIAAKLGLASVAAEGATVAATEVGVAGVAGATGITGLGVGLGTAAATAAPFILAGAAVVGTGLLIKNSLDKEVIPKVNLFADSVVTTSKQIKDANGQIVTSYGTTVTKISEGTQKAVEGYLALDKGATDALNNLYINSTTITDKTVTDVATKYNTMNTKVKTAMDTRFADEYKTMSDFYAKSDTLTAKEETAALAKMKTDHIAKKAEEDKATAAILAIYKKAASENRSISLADEEAIKTIQNRKTKTAITVMSKGEADSKIILDRMKEYGARVTAEQAGKEIENANKSRDGTVKAANEEYTKRVAAIKATCDQSTPQGKKMADSLIEDAERQKRMSIEKAEILRSGVVGKIMAMNSENEGKINTSTGKVMGFWDTMHAKWDNWHPISKESEFTTTISTKYVSTGDKTAAVAANKNINSYLLTNKIPRNAAGTNNFGGGLTTMHEKGYEVYNLNKGSQILNHEASLDLITKTAQEVAKGVLASSQGNNGGGQQDIIVPVNLDGREIARITAPYMSNNLALASRGRR